MDNVSEPWVIDEARAKLKAIEELEKSASGNTENGAIEIDLTGGNDNQEEFIDQE